MTESKKPTERLDGGPYSSTNTNISTGNNCYAKTLIEYDYDEVLEIKEEIIQDPETVIGQISYKTKESKFCKVDIRSDEILGVEHKLLTLKNQEMQESKQEKKYACEKCARRYKWKNNLDRHLKYECGISPQFRCKFCSRRFAHKKDMIFHVDFVHIERNFQATGRKYNCEKCPRMYSSSSALCQHKRLEHATVKPQFFCDFCGYKTNRKPYLSKHITVLHLTTSKQKHTCDTCSRSYTWLSALHRHIRIGHAAVKPQFICDYCGLQANNKYNLSRHMSACHSHTSKSFHKCKKCSRGYATASGLNHHNRLEHAGIKEQFTCDFCGYKSNLKGSLLKHITLRHWQISQSRHQCEKCDRSYATKKSLTHHTRLEHAAVKPEFTCDHCGHKTNLKTSLSTHMFLRHLQTLKSSHECDECSRSYASLSALSRHKRSVHPTTKP